MSVDASIPLRILRQQLGEAKLRREAAETEVESLEAAIGLIEPLRIVVTSGGALPPNQHIAVVRRSDGFTEIEPRFATNDEIARHAEKQDVSWSDAWRYFERSGYDMSAAEPQYPDSVDLGSSFRD